VIGDRSLRGRCWSSRRGTGKIADLDERTEFALKRGALFVGEIVFEPKYTLCCMEGIYGEVG
jgi:hypothetical protein